MFRGSERSCATLLLPSHAVFIRRFAAGGPSGGVDLRRGPSMAGLMKCCGGQPGRHHASRRGRSAQCFLNRWFFASTGLPVAAADRGVLALRSGIEAKQA